MNVIIYVEYIDTLLLFRERQNVITVEPITIIRSGKPGQPAKVVDAEFLKEALSAKRNITVKGLAMILGIHRNTLQ